MDQKIRDMLAAIDRQDLKAFEAFLSEDARFVFGNGEAIHGRELIVSVVQGVLRSLRSISHTAQRFWEVDDIAICEGRVRCKRSTRRSSMFCRSTRMNVSLTTGCMWMHPS